MSILKKMVHAFGRSDQSTEGPAPSTPEQSKALEGPSLSQWCTFGAHMYRRPDDVLSVVFTNQQKNITRMIVDDEGYICQFPGVDRQSTAGLNPACLYPQIRFRTDFVRKEDGTIMMIWQVQPDGRYWEDEDGYGRTPDDEVCLYTFIDENGCFTGPFRLYAINGRHIT